MLFIGQTIYYEHASAPLLRIAFPTIYYKYDMVYAQRQLIYIDHFITHIFMVFSNIDPYPNPMEIETKNVKRRTFGTATINLA